MNYTELRETIASRLWRDAMNKHFQDRVEAVRKNSDSGNSVQGAHGGNT
jgi:hypothetical protein